METCEDLPHDDSVDPHKTLPQGARYDESSTKETGHDASSPKDISDDEKPLKGIRNDDNSPKDISDDERALKGIRNDDSSPKDSCDDERPLKGIRSDDSSPKDITDDERPLKGIMNDDNSLEDISDDEKPLKGIRNDDNSLEDISDDETPLKGIRNDDNSLEDISDDEKSLKEIRNDNSSPKDVSDDEKPLKEIGNDDSSPKDISDDEKPLKGIRNDDSSPKDVSYDERPLKGINDDEKSRKGIRDVESLAKGTGQDENSTKGIKDDEGSVEGIMDESLTTEIKHDENSTKGIRRSGRPTKRPRKYVNAPTEISDDESLTKGPSNENSPKDNSIDHSGNLSAVDHDESLEDHDDDPPKGDCEDPYKLNWPGLMTLPVFIIDPNTKVVYEPTNPLPTSLGGLNSVEFKYVMVQSVVDLFTADCRLRALDTLIHLASLYDLHKFQTVAKVGYMHIGTLLAFLVVYPWCDSFQKVRGTVLQFLIRYVEGQCWVCGFVRRDCRCGQSTYHEKVVRTNHSIEYADKEIQVGPPTNVAPPVVGHPMTMLMNGGAPYMQPGMAVPMSNLRFNSNSPFQMTAQFPGMPTPQNVTIPRGNTSMYQVFAPPPVSYPQQMATPSTGADPTKPEAPIVTTGSIPQNPGWGGPFVSNPSMMWTMGGPQYGYPPATQLNNPGLMSPPQTLPSRLMPPPYQPPPSMPVSTADPSAYMRSIVRPGVRIMLPNPTLASSKMPGGGPVLYNPPAPPPAKKTYVKNQSTQTRPVTREKKCKSTSYMMSTVKRKSMDDAGDKLDGDESDAKKAKVTETGEVAVSEKTPTRSYTEAQLWRRIEEDEDVKTGEDQKSGEADSKSSLPSLGKAENEVEPTAEVICRRIVEDVVGDILGDIKPEKQGVGTETPDATGGSAHSEVQVNEDKSAEVPDIPAKDETTDKDRIDGKTKTVVIKVMPTVSTTNGSTKSQVIDLTDDVPAPIVVVAEIHSADVSRTDVRESINSATLEDGTGVDLEGASQPEITQLDNKDDSLEPLVISEVETKASGDAPGSEKGLGTEHLKNIASLCGQIGEGDAPGVSVQPELDATSGEFKRVDSLTPSDSKPEVSTKVSDGSAKQEVSTKTKVIDWIIKENARIVAADGAISHKEPSERPVDNSPVVASEDLNLKLASSPTKKKTCYARFEYIPTGEKVFRCMHKENGQCFDNQQAAEMHDRAHRYDGDTCRPQLYCHLCDYTVANAHWYDLLRHLKSCHFVMLTSKQFGCTLCGIVFENEDELSSHMEFHYNSRFKCIYCGALLTTWKHVQQHITSECTDRKKGPDAIFYLGCPYCPLVFHKKTIKKIHTLSHVDTGLVCVFCRDDTPWDVWRHLRKHYHQRHAKRLLGKISVLNPPEKYRRPKCHVCQTEFRLQEDHRLHMVKVHDLVPYVAVECEICQKVYRHEKARDRHAKKVHVEDLKCNKCSFVAKTQILLRDHQKVEHIERPHTCSECDRSFVLYKELKVHMVRHATNSIHLCKTCGIELSTYAELKRHKVKEHPTMASMSGIGSRDAIICPECNFRCYSRIALGKHLKKLHPDQDLRSDDPDHAYYNNVTSPSPIAKRQKLVVVRPMRKKKPPYSKPQPLKLMKGKKGKKLLNGKGHKGLMTKGVKLRSKRYGCARLRTIADYHREKRIKEAEDLMNVTTPAGCGAMSARKSSSKQYKEAASIVDLDHCYVKVDEPSVYKTRVRIENQDSLKLTVVRTPETATFVHSSGDDNVDASGGSDTIQSPERSATHMQETILEGASRLVTMLRQQMESGDDLSNLLPSTAQYETETMSSSDIHDDVGIAGLDLMNDVGGNIEQQLTDILDSMAQETSPCGTGSRHAAKTVPDLDNLVQDNIDRDMQLVESCDDDVADGENTTQGVVEGEGCGMDVDEIELGEADYQLWQKSHNSGANIEVQDDSTDVREADSSTSVPVVAVDSSVVNEDAESSNGSVTDHRGADNDDGEHAAASEKDQQPCLVDHQYY